MLCFTDRVSKKLTEEARTYLRCITPSYIFAHPLNDMGKGGIGKDKSKEKYAAIISYKPHRVAKQLGFDQDVPGPLPKVGTDQLYAGNFYFYHGFLPNSQSVFWIPAFPPVSLCLKA